MILGQSYRNLSFLCVCCCCLSVRHRLKLPLFEFRWDELQEAWNVTHCDCFFLEWSFFNRSRPWQDLLQDSHILIGRNRNDYENQMFCLGLSSETGFGVGLYHFSLVYPHWLKGIYLVVCTIAVCGTHLHALTTTVSAQHDISVGNLSLLLQKLSYWKSRMWAIFIFI